MIAPATQLLWMKTAAYLRPDPLPPMSDGGNALGIPSPWMSNPTLSQLEHGLDRVTEGSHPDAAQIYKDKIHAHMAANRPPLMAELPTGPSAGEHFSNSARQVASATGDLGRELAKGTGDAVSDVGRAAIVGGRGAAELAGDVGASIQRGARAVGDFGTSAGLLTGATGALAARKARQLAAATPGALAAGAEMVGNGASRAGEIAGHLAAPAVIGMGQGISAVHDAVEGGLSAGRAAAVKGYQKAVNPYHAGALSAHLSLSPQMQAMFKSMGK
jgi:hypothetical protein